MNLAKLRQETPGCQHVTHLNNAGAALMPAPVHEVVRAYLEEEALTGGYETARRHRQDHEGVYHSLARLLGCAVEEIALTENATRAWDMVFYGLPLEPGDRILTSVSEYASNYIAFLQRARQTGAKIEVVPNDGHGQLDLHALSEMLDDTVKLVAINHVPTNSGLVQPAAKIGEIVANFPALYLLDACQSVGQMPTRVDELGCDFLSATSRKYLRGPRGAGFLYARKACLDRIEPPFLDLHSATWTGPNDYQLRSDARRFETWEAFLAGRLGMGKAAEYALEVGLEQAYNRLRDLAAQLRTGLTEVPGVRLTDVGQEQGGIVTFTLDQTAPEQVRDSLAAQAINVSTCTVRSARLDMEARGLDEVVRASVHYYNTTDEIEKLVETLRTDLSLLRDP